MWHICSPFGHNTTMHCTQSAFASTDGSGETPPTATGGRTCSEPQRKKSGIALFFFNNLFIIFSPLGYRAVRYC